MLAATLVAFACILFSVTYRIDDPDFWQHLLVGKAIWSLHRVPLEHLWTWPAHGRPEVLPSWGFRALLWPFWAAGGVGGLYAWRWLSTLAAFGIVFGLARRMGANGFSTLVVLAIAGLVWRARSEVRPETLVAPLLALELWVLERRRLGDRPDRSWLLVAIAWVWANVHISYWLGLALIAFYALDEWVGARGRHSRHSDRAPLPLLGLGAAALAISFVNPFGWRALWQPFEYFFVWRHEPIFRTVGELLPLSLSRHWRDGLPLLLFGWPVLIVTRAWRARRIDLAETCICATFTALVCSAERFTGLYAIAAAPFVARDLAERLAGSRLAVRPRAPWARAAIAAAACVVAGLFEWSRPAYHVGIGIDRTHLPDPAGRFMIEQGIRGRGFNPYYLGGWMLWTFWPDPGRLPFMDIHQSGTREDRRLVVEAYQSGSAWHALDREHSFDYALLEAYPDALVNDLLLPELDADTTFALVFRDDVSALFVRRRGTLAPVAARLAYRRLPADDRRLAAMLPSLPGDREARAELERMRRESPKNSRAHTLIASLEWLEGRPALARSHLREALKSNPRYVGAHERLGILALADSLPGEALREFAAEQHFGRGSLDLPGRITAARAMLASERPGR